MNFHLKLVQKLMYLMETKRFNHNEFNNYLGFGKPNAQVARAPSRFILPLSDCEEMLESIWKILDLILK